ncbi:hypothetical protein PVAP13_2NG092646 [Panicum virgatum]|uniref:Uncharacterized protein n=1 Tax=Panicum virgatum TaxID=38727 RepID=A0A8T0VGJ1_PANVG|nr:hypothetical protein PVAP13_2NG092646 [Panicum virgatum]
MEYHTKLEFCWAPFLVESNSDNPKIHNMEHRIAERIEGHGLPHLQHAPASLLREARARGTAWPARGTHRRTAAAARGCIF